MSKRVGVLMGGWGEEREISIKSGEAVVSALEAQGHRVTRIFAGSGLDRSLRAADLDVAFIALHGRMGEDGKVQGLLEVMEIPYTGSGVMASALAMNKPFAKRLFRHGNLPVAAGYDVGEVDPAMLAAIHGDLGFPCIVKPACGGSSVGLSKVYSLDALEGAIAQARRYGGRALVERAATGREVTVAILEDRALGTCEIAFNAQSFDYDAKYRGGSSYHLPPRLPPARIANLEALALGAYRSLGCRGYGRVDLIASDDDNEILLEVNTLPGMTAMSLLPKIARHAGIAFEDLVERIVLLAALDDVAVLPPCASHAPSSAVRATG